MKLADGNPLGDRASQMRDDLIGGIRRRLATLPVTEWTPRATVTMAARPTNSIQLETAGPIPRVKVDARSHPTKLRKLLEPGAQLKPSQWQGGAEGEGMYLTQLLGKEADEFEQLREQLGEIGTMPGAGRLMLGRGRPGFLLRLRRMGLCCGRLSAQLVPPARDPGRRRRRRFFRRHARSATRDVLPQVRRQFPAYPPGFLSNGAWSRRRRRNRFRSHDRVARRAAYGRSARQSRLQARKKEARDVATLFLLDMSASTDEPIHREPRKLQRQDDADNDDWMKAWQRRP